MLETVKQVIEDSPFITFEQYFTRYVFEIQDSNIDNEFAFMLRHNSIDSHFLEVIINNELKGVLP